MIDRQACDGDRIQIPSLFRVSFVVRSMDTSNPITSCIHTMRRLTTKGDVGFTHPLGRRSPVGTQHHAPFANAAQGLVQLGNNLSASDRRPLGHRTQTRGKTVYFDRYRLLTLHRQDGRVLKVRRVTVDDDGAQPHPAVLITDTHAFSRRRQAEYSTDLPPGRIRGRVPLRAENVALLSTFLQTPATCGQRRWNCETRAFSDPFENEVPPRRSVKS